MKQYCAIITIILCSLYANNSIAQNKKIRDELRRAEKYEESKKMDTYHALEKYLTNKQRYELNMYYVKLNVPIPNERKNNFWLKKSAEEGNICAMLNLAYSYKVGRIVDKDSVSSWKWFLKAMKSNSDRAYLYYGFFCMDNTFGNQVADSTIYYLKEAEKRGFYNATLALAFAYKYGIHTEKNELEANNYLNKYKAIGKKSTIDFTSSTDYYFIPNEANLEYLWNIQIGNLYQELKQDNQLVITIQTNGCCSRHNHILSWLKANDIRNLLIANGITPDRIDMRVGGNDHSSVVEIIKSRRNEQFVSLYPPPINPEYVRRIFLDCDE